MLDYTARVIQPGEGVLTLTVTSQEVLDAS